ncbi:hypothetical protein K7432_000061 [Basidiobolus ranarum]|uniref:RRM domain-containing protein n=1 Tax=Basidiobolus ranarum TaxID=34480 RepID=A0ABR2X5D3_9FUNG
MSEQQKVKNFRKPTTKNTRSPKSRDPSESSSIPQYDATSWQNWSATGNTQVISSEEVVSSIIKSQVDKSKENFTSKKESLQAPEVTLKSSYSSEMDNKNVRVFDTQAGRLLCIANIRGNFSYLNQLAKRYEAVAVLHCGEFGFYDTGSCNRIPESSLRNIILSSPLLSKEEKVRLNSLPLDSLRKQPTCTELSQFSSVLAGTLKFDVPVYTIYGANEDTVIVEKLLEEKIAIPQLHILHSGSSGVIELGGNKIRLLGISGDYSLQRLFVPENQLTGSYINLVRMGKLIDTAQKVYDPSEVRILMATVAPTKHEVIAQLAHTLNVDYAISPEENAKYCLSYTETSILADPQTYQEKLVKARSSLVEIWEKIRVDIENSHSPQQVQWLKSGLAALNTLPETESLLENFWTFGLPEPTKGSLILDISNGSIAAETKSTGIDFGHRLKNALKLQTKTKSTVSSTTTTNGVEKDEHEVSTPTRNGTMETLTNQTPPKIQLESNGNAVKQDNEDHKCASSWDDVVSEDVGQMNWDEPVFDGPMNWDEDLPENISKGHMIDWSEDVFEENGSWVDLNAQNDPALSTAASRGSPAMDFSEDETTPSTKSGVGASASVWADADPVKTAPTPSTGPYTIWVGGFNKTPYTDEDVKGIFGSLRSAINQVKLVHDRHTGQQRAFCFVDFKDPESMERGLRHDGCEWNAGILKINRAEHREQTFNRPRTLVNPSRRGGYDGHYDDSDPSRIPNFRGRGRSRGRGRGRSFSSFD